VGVEVIGVRAARSAFQARSELLGEYAIAQLLRLDHLVGVLRKRDAVAPGRFAPRGVLLDLHGRGLVCENDRSAA